MSYDPQREQEIERAFRLDGGYGPPPSPPRKREWLWIACTLALAIAWSCS